MKSSPEFFPAFLTDGGFTTSSISKRLSIFSLLRISLKSSYSETSRTVRPFRFVGLPAASTGLISTARRAGWFRYAGSFCTKTPGILVFTFPQSAPVFKNSDSFSDIATAKLCLYSNLTPKMKVLEVTMSSDLRFFV